MRIDTAQAARFEYYRGRSSAELRTASKCALRAFRSRFNCRDSEAAEALASHLDAIEAAAYYRGAHELAEASEAERGA